MRPILATGPAPSTRVYFDNLRALLEQLDVTQIDAFAALLFRAWHDDRRVFVFGNGGSACTASHFVVDFVKTAAVAGQKRLQCTSLIDNYGLTTALGNDVGYDDTLVYPLASFARPGDVAVAISCSGNSRNVVHACEWARANGLTVVCLSGFTGGRMAALADLHINVPHENYGLVEDLHLAIGHAVTQRLRVQVQAAIAAE